MTKALADATSKILEILSPLNSDERLRIVQAALLLLGDQFAPPSKKPSPQQEGNSDIVEGVSPAGVAWMKKNNITLEEIQNFLHFDNGTALPISLPGSSEKRSEQTVNTYLMQGLAAFLSTGDAAFSDETARQLCTHFGCYDKNNHATSLKGLGNKVTGSKNSGWKLTAPGFAAVAVLIKSQKP